MKVLLTGACGRVGTAIVDHLHDSFDFKYFDQQAHPTHQTHIGDVADYPSLAQAFEDVDHLVHLAAASKVDSPWSTVLQSNVIGGYNAFEAARRNQVERVVFASTNHVMGTYEREHSPALYEPDHDLTLSRDDPMRPDSHYASSKAFNEAQARHYVEHHEYPKRVYILRIGSVRGSDEDHPYADAERGVKRGEWEHDSERYRQEVKRMKATWQSRRDVATMIAACLENETVTYDVFYGVSDNDRRWFDIEHARSVLGYDPQDNGEDWNEPPNIRGNEI